MGRGGGELVKVGAGVVLASLVWYQIFDLSFNIGKVLRESNEPEGTNVCETSKFQRKDIRSHGSLQRM